jgi:magnesium-transporting ATPase (P-type)
MIMDKQNFDKELNQMTKPELNQLKHRDILAKAITKEKDKSVVSFWWLSISLYIIAMFLMKSFFMPQTTLISNIHDLTKEQKISSAIFLLFLPVILIILNFFSIRKIYFLSGSPKTVNFLKTVWFNIIIFFSSILIIIIYSL